MPAKKPCVLVVDDDVRMLRLIQRVLELEGFKVLRTNSSESALDMLYEEAPDLVLLDVMIPGLDGYAVCRRIREFSQIPIVMVTARGDELERVEGLDAGADDYVTKPFSTRELTARVRAVLRRSGPRNEHPEPEVRIGDLLVDFPRNGAFLSGRELNLTAIEYKLISYLARNAGRVVTPDQILENVWDRTYLGDTHLLQVHVARLRQKLGDDARNPTYILTRPGIGYTMVKQP